MRPKGLLEPEHRRDLVSEMGSEIARCFELAKSSPFPAVRDWAPLNVSPDSPLADRLLAELDVADFDAHQETQQAKGY